MNQQVYHLATLLISVAAILILILTGHDVNGGLDALLTSVVGGIAGGSAGFSVGNLVSNTTANASAVQQGAPK
jgi:hypothetical protein